MYRVPGICLLAALRISALRACVNEAE